MDLIEEYIIRKRENEKLKDILIDHVFDYCFNEKVVTIEADGYKYSAPSRQHIPKEELEYFRTLSRKKMHYITRDKEYCQIIFSNDGLHSNLLDKLDFLGYKKGKNLQQDIIEAYKFLKVRSYFSENNPNINEVKLTQKGFQHYLDGKSFEDNYINKQHSSWAIFISILSLIIALLSIVLNL